MADVPLEPDWSESRRTRTVRDFKTFFGTVTFYFVAALMAVAGACVSVPFGNDPKHTTASKVVATAAGLAGGAVASLAVALVVIGTRAGPRQRREALAALLASRDDISCELRSGWLTAPQPTLILRNRGPEGLFTATLEMDESGFVNQANISSGPANAFRDGVVERRLFQGESAEIDVAFFRPADDESRMHVKVLSTGRDAYSVWIVRRRAALGMYQARLLDDPWPDHPADWADQVGLVLGAVRQATEHVPMTSSTHQEHHAAMSTLTTMMRQSGVVGNAFVAQWSVAERALDESLHGSLKPPLADYLAEGQTVMGRWLAELEAELAAVLN
jgi:hypothetical protein